VSPGDTGCKVNDEQHHLRRRYSSRRGYPSRLELLFWRLSAKNRRSFRCASRHDHHCVGTLETMESGKGSSLWYQLALDRMYKE